MSRLHLDFPDDCFRFSTRMTVRSTEINAGCNLANDALVSLLSEARSRFLFAHGVDDTRTAGTAIIVTDLATVYRAEARARDELLFEVGVCDLNKYGGDIVFRVSRPADATQVALAKYGFVFFDYRSGKVASMPAEFRASVAGVA